MKTIINYAKEETRTFKDYPFNDVDSLILSTISYYDLSSLVPNLFSKDKYLIKDIDLKNIDLYVLDLPDKKRHKSLLTNIVNNPRFNNLYLDNYYEKESVEEEIGFKALTIESNDFIYVSYMGTKTISIISWKEDFNLAYLCPVPSQKLAVKYLNKVMLETYKKVYVGGHSKGGNLAIYASMNTFLINKFRIKKIYSHDGPGFLKKVFDSRKYNKIKNKISKTVPTNSIVGMLFYTKEDYKIIKSSGIGVNQHSPLNWNVLNNNFIYQKDLSWSSKHLDKTLSNWLDNISDIKKKEFIDALFSILLSDDFDSKYISNKNYLKMINALRKGLNNIDKDSKDMIIDVLKKLIEQKKLNILNSNE